MIITDLSNHRLHENDTRELKTGDRKKMCRSFEILQNIDNPKQTCSLQISTYLVF